MCVHVHKLASMHAWTHVYHIIERKKAKLHCQLITKILFSSSGVLFKVEKYSENWACLVLLTLGLLTLSTVSWAQNHWRRLQRTASFPPRQGAALVSGITVWTVVGSQSLQGASALGDLFHCLSRLPHWISVWRVGAGAQRCIPPSEAPPSTQGTWSAHREKTGPSTILLACRRKHV